MMEQLNINDTGSASADAEPMSKQDLDAQTKAKYFKLLPRVRKILLKEFKFKETTVKEIASQLGQERYNMIKGRDGERRASTQWKTMLEKLWTLNCAIPDKKDRRNFNDSFKLENVTFSRRQIYEERIFRADLTTSLKNQIRQLGYERIYVNIISKTDWNTNEEYETLLIKVPV
jgi:hypothetical protein